MNNENNAHLRKRELKNEGKVELPVDVDTERYLFGNIRLKDALYMLPFLAISIIIIVMMINGGIFSPKFWVPGFIPALIGGLLIFTKHPSRKNISLAAQIGWRLNFFRANKIFAYRNMEVNIMEDDIRTQLGIFNIANDCFETNDNRLVKVLEVSSVNLTGMSQKDRIQTLEDYETFLNDLNSADLPFQIEQIAKPVNLQSYVNWVHEETKNNEDVVKRLLADSYIDKMNEIQKSKNMVSKSRYVVVSEKIGLDKDKALDNVYKKAANMKTSIENMLSRHYKLDTQILDNEKLFSLIYSTIDYQSAQLDSDVQLQEEINLPVTYTADELKEMRKKWDKEVSEKIL